MRYTGAQVARAECPEFGVDVDVLTLAGGEGARGQDIVGEPDDRDAAGRPGQGDEIM